MATLHQTTTSTTAEISSTEKVQNLIEQYKHFFPTKTTVENGKITIYGYQGFRVEQETEDEHFHHRTEEFLHELREHLEEELIIQTVGNEKCRFPVVAFQYRVSPEDGVFYSELGMGEREIDEGDVA